MFSKVSLAVVCIFVSVLFSCATSKTTSTTPNHVETSIQSTVKKFEQGKWISIRSGLPTTAEPLCLTFSFELPTLMTIKANLGKDPLETYQLVDNKWVLKSSGENVLTSNFNDLLLNENKAYFAYTDKLTDYKITVKKFKNNNWDLLGKQGISVGECRSISITKNDKNEIVLQYLESKSNTIVLQKWNGSKWDLQPPSYQYKGAMVSRSSIFAKNIPYMLFSSGGEVQLFYLK